MTLDGDLAAVRAVARQLRGTTRPLDPRRLSALASSLDHSVRGIDRGVQFLRAEAVNARPPSVEVGDPEPYRGLDLVQAARMLAERTRAIGLPTNEREEERWSREVASEIDGFVSAVAASGRRTSPLAKAASLPDPDADSPGQVKRGARRTSQEAATLAEPRTGTNRRRVLDAVSAVARDPRVVGLTDVELERATGLKPNSVRPRRVELVSGGWLADSGVTREHYGREHTVWVLTDKAARLLAGARSA